MTGPAGSTPRRALLVGASGLVGGLLLRRLLVQEIWASVVAPVRRPLAVSHPKLRAPVADFEALGSFDIAESVQEAFCCLGTTIRKAGSQAAFRTVDHDYVAAAATLARKAGARHFIMVSALGADSDSRVFYNRVKGEAERAVGALGLPRVTFLRPSLLAGPRNESRPGERAGLLFAALAKPFLIGPLRRYRAIDADDVAAAMVAIARAGTPIGPVESEEIFRIARTSGAV